MSMTTLTLCLHHPISPMLQAQASYSEKSKLLEAPFWKHPRAVHDARAGKTTLRELSLTSDPMPSHTKTPSSARFSTSRSSNGQATSFSLAVKDNIATASPTSTSCGSNILKNYHSPYPATIVTQLQARGAQVAEKTALDEFGMGSHTTNGPMATSFQGTGETPETKYSVGGSSGGSALAVASGVVDFALGTDTGGSVRLPAAYCGVVGFKPSYGMLSRHGVVPYANSLDTVGLLARKVQQISELLVESGLWAEHDPQDPTSLSEKARARCAGDRAWYRQSTGTPFEQWVTAQGDLSKITFGVPLEYNIAELEPCVRDAWVAAGTQLQERGARVVPVSLPSTRHALSAYYVIAPAEASSNLAKYDGVRYGTRAEGTGDADNGVLYSRTRGAGFGAEVQRRILLGSYTLSSEAMDNYFIQAQRVRRLVRRDFDRVFELPNPLHEPETFDLSEMDSNVLLENKFGPTQVDFLLCPTAPTLPPRLAEVLKQTPLDAYMNDVFTVPASLAGLPAISVPMPVSGAPQDANAPRNAGLQLIGQYWDDARLLAVADNVARTLSSET
ncbi:amidase signature enzyme [Thozetella sp. PMI_491]|nr:amidase signature enzyme [Thozetella sp. PMI_491]